MPIGRKKNNEARDRDLTNATPGSKRREGRRI
jgi:hypothetical protein